MGMIIARRKAREFSPFKYFFKTLIKVCDPDEVWISSGFYYNNFWNTHDNAGDTLRDLLSGRSVVLVGDPRIINDIPRLKNDLLNDLGAGATVRAFTHNEPDSNLRSNDIQLYKDNRDIAGIVGSSSCTTRDLDIYQKRDSSTVFDIQTDMIYFDPSFDNDIITAMSSDDSEFREVPPELIGIDIFGIERRPEIDIMCNTNLKTFVTMSGLFHEI